MKFSNKITLASAILCAFCVGFVFLLVSKNLKGAKSNGDLKRDFAKTIEAENNISETIEDKKQEETYIIKLKDSGIYAYVELSDGTQILWNSTPAPPTLSVKDKEILKRGIITNSFEELCLYFESYSS